jgi:hypothetical protein
VCPLTCPRRIKSLLEWNTSGAYRAGGFAFLQTKRNSGSDAHRTTHLDLLSVRLNNVLDNRQPQARTTFMSVPAFFDAVKSLK